MDVRLLCAGKRCHLPGQLRELGNGRGRERPYHGYLLPGSTYVAHSGSFTPTIEGDRVVIWDLGTVPGSGNTGSYGQLRLTAHLDNGLTVGDRLTNTLAIGSSQEETNYGNNTGYQGDTVLAPYRDLRVSKSLLSGEVKPGEMITYRIVVSNSGNTSAANVLLSDTLPVSTTYVSSYNDTYFPAYARDAFSPTLEGGRHHLGSGPAHSRGHRHLLPFGPR